VENDGRADVGHDQQELKDRGDVNRVLGHGSRDELEMSEVSADSIDEEDLCCDAGDECCDE
jgi:hypothetical protein